jgi:pSer/pThr/pTyr-binding forkhead associated (FHA) protein
MKSSGMKRVTVEIHYADGRTELKQLEDGSFIIGRDTGDIVLKSPMVSGRHGELKVSGARIVYTDQGSTNGSYTIDGTRLKGPLQMIAGTGIRIGECKIILKAVHVLSSKTVMQAPVKPALSSTRTVLGQPAMMAPVSSVPPPAKPTGSAVPRGSVPPPSPDVMASAKGTVPPPVPASANIPPTGAAATAVTEPAPPPYAMESPVAGTPRDAAPAAAEPEFAPEAETHSAAAVAAELSSTPAQESDADDAAVSEPAVAEPAAAASSDAIETDSASAWADDATEVGRFSFTMDLGALINAPMKDSGWIVKCLIIGLITIIPIAGVLNLFGWMIAIYNNRKQGVEELPPANLSYIGDGVKLLLAWLPAIGAYVAVNIVLGIITFILPFLFFLYPLVNLALGLAVFAATPAVTYLCVEKDVKWASMKFNTLIAFAKSNTQAYVQLLIAFFIASVISGLGGIVVIGTLITAPFGMAMQAAILADIKEE